MFRLRSTTLGVHACALAFVCLLCTCGPRAEFQSMPLSAVIDANSDSSRHGQLIRTQALVTYSDPEWHVLFVSDKGLGMFIQPPADLDVRSGDLVEIEGRTASTAVGFDNPRFTIL